MVGTSTCKRHANLQPSWGALLRRVASPAPGYTPKSLRSSSPPPPSSPRLRTKSLSSSFRSSVATTSTLPEYSQNVGEFERVLDSTDANDEVKQKKCKCPGNCLSLIVPTIEEKVIDFGSPETPSYTTPLRPPPRSPSHRLSACLPLTSPLPSPAQVIFPERPPSPSPDPDQDDSLEFSECETPDDNSDADSAYESAEEDSPAHHRRSKPPALLIRATLPHGAPNAPCNCSDPLCPGGELDQAYDAPLPCNCGLPDCAGGDMSLAWKMRADGLRKSGRVRHVNKHDVAVRSVKRGIVWGYSAAHI